MDYECGYEVLRRCTSATSCNLAQSVRLSRLTSAIKLSALTLFLQCAFHRVQFWHQVRSRVIGMSYPYQCLLYCPQSDHLDHGILVAASGQKLQTFDVASGKHVSTWPVSHKHVEPVMNHSEMAKDMDEAIPSITKHDATERPPKRRKVSSVREDSGSSAEIVVENETDNEGDSLKDVSSFSPVIKLACDSTSRHVVAVTSEDKAIRVFDLSTEGVLKQLSER